MAKSTASVDVAEHDHHHATELVKEATTMGLYVAICLLAALTVASHAELEHGNTVLKLVWGTTLGLALAHWFAFRLSARLVASGAVRRTDAQLAAAQFVGSLLVAAIGTVPVLLFDDNLELDVTRWVLAAFISLVGYFVARNSGATVARSAVYASAVTLIALAIVVIKNALSGH